jgi:hypothetical protein
LRQGLVLIRKRQKDPPERSNRLSQTRASRQSRCAQISRVRTIVR